MDNRKADSRKKDSGIEENKTKENETKSFCAKQGESEKLIIEGNAFYEIDLECIREKQRRSKHSK